MLPILLLLVGGAVVVSSMGSGNKSSGGNSSGKDWKNVRIIPRSFPPPKPFYAPNVKSAHYPLCQFSISGQNAPVQYNAAIDVTGIPWTVFYIDDNYNIAKSTWPAKGFCYGYAGGVENGTTGGEVWDVDTWGWVPCKSGTYQWVPGKFKDEPDFTDNAIDFVEKKFIPGLITIAGAYIGGVGGALAAAALTAAWDIVRGQKITDALIDAYQQHLQGEVEKTTYYQTYKSVVATYNQTKEQLEAIRAEYMKLYGYSDPAQIEKAVNAGIGAARAKQVQDAVIYAVKKRGAPEAEGWLDECLKRGVYLQDWVVAMYGTDGSDLMKWANDTANAALDAGKDPFVAVKPNVIGPNSGKLISALEGLLRGS